MEVKYTIQRLNLESQKWLFLWEWYLLNEPPFNWKQKIPLLKFQQTLCSARVLKCCSHALSRHLWPCAFLVSFFGMWLSYKFIIENLKTWEWCSIIASLFLGLLGRTGNSESKVYWLFHMQTLFFISRKIYMCAEGKSFKFWWSIDGKSIIKVTIFKWHQTNNRWGFFSDLILLFCCCFVVEVTKRGTKRNKM
jgi:hypothetical protein